jgi:hypothetical protein
MRIGLIDTKTSKQAKRAGVVRIKLALKYWDIVVSDVIIRSDVSIFEIVSTNKR